MGHSRSSRLFAAALRCIPGGVNSPVRAFKSVGSEPIFIESGAGCRVRDVDGNSYIDYVGSWGPLIHGHCHRALVKALTRVLQRGTSFGVSTAVEVDLARMLCDVYPSMQKVRLVNSGTEATMSAIRVARAFTGRDLVVKFDGCYHGHSDGLLVQAGSGVLTLGLPDSPGVPSAYTALTVSVPFNNLRAVSALFAAHPSRIACVIVEPVVGNAGVVVPAKGFLTGLRKITREHGAVLIFDEVMTGSRVARGGAQELYGIKPDMTCLGKIIGGGLPTGAFGGRRELMDLVAPAGPVYQAGTLSGNPLAVTAGLVSLAMLQKPGVYERLERASAALASGLLAGARKAGVPVTLNRVGSMFTVFFTGAPVTDYDTARAADRSRFSVFFREMLKRGVLLPPSQFEAAFVSLAHKPPDIRATVRAAEEAFRVLA